MRGWSTGGLLLLLAIESMIDGVGVTGRNLTGIQNVCVCGAKLLHGLICPTMISKMVWRGGGRNMIGTISRSRAKNISLLSVNGTRA